MVTNSDTARLFEAQAFSGPARFEGTIEFPEIQIVTIGTPCCGRMTIILGVKLNMKYLVYTQVYMYILILYPAKMFGENDK